MTLSCLTEHVVSTLGARQVASENGTNLGQMDSDGQGNIGISRVH